ncbi:MAG TPA: enoyl-CoA-hydratase DpgB, partial [Rugosimonospora sp.]|nr:enoyl-CoA-hydratase DpgB [Rugosimonospora sp.]
MRQLSRLTDVYLEIDGGAALSGALIEAVNGVCDRIEDSNKNLALLVWLDGTGTPAADPYPHHLGVHTVNQWERALRRLERVPALTLAVVRGACRGPALDVLLTTDYRIATPDSSLQPAVVAGGTWPGMGLFRLASQLGPARARRLGLLGLALPAADALHWGVLDQLTEEPVPASHAVLAMLGDRGGKELAIRRQLLGEARAT